jgi:hypothetical protein
MPPDQQSTNDKIVELGERRRVAQWDVLPQQIKQRHLVQTQGRLNQYLGPFGSNEFRWRDLDGWVDGVSVWSYVSATSFSVKDDQTDIFTTGLKLRWIQNNVQKYGYVASSAYSGSITTVTIVSNDDYTFAADLAISNVQYSREENPQGFPGSFDYASFPTLVPESGGFTNNPSILSCRFSMQGRQLSFYIEIQLGNPTGGMAGLFIEDLPIAPTRIETGTGLDEIGPVQLLPYTQTTSGGFISVYRYDGSTPFVDNHILQVGATYLV